MDLVSESGKAITSAELEDVLEAEVFFRREEETDDKGAQSENARY